MTKDLKLTKKLGKRTEKGTLITENIVKQNQEINDDLIIIEDNTAKIIEAMDFSVARILEAIGIAAERNAKKICPVDTGRLRNSITHSIDNSDDTAIIGTNVEYAVYVHNGTAHPHREGNPFLVNAAVRNQKQYANIAKTLLENAQ